MVFFLKILSKISQKRRKFLIDFKNSDDEMQRGNLCTVLESFEINGLLLSHCKRLTWTVDHVLGLKDRKGSGLK